MSDFIDLHCHVLHQLDDGPDTIDEAVQLVRGLEQLGFVELHPTPHQFSGHWAPERAEREGRATELRQALEAGGCETVVHDPAGENMWDDLFLQRQADQSFPKYPKNNAFLMEFPPGRLPPAVLERLFELRLKGLLPVIAHVERYPEIMDNPRLLDGRAAISINISTLGGMAGLRTRIAARRLVGRAEIHALATDSHGLPDLHYTAAGLAWLAKKLGSEAMDRLLVDGPRTILSGEIPD